MHHNNHHAHFSPQVQAILPVLENLSIDERFSLIGFLVSHHSNHQTMMPNAQQRFNRFLNAMTMSDDFDDYLGDDFWFPDDDILYK